MSAAFDTLDNELLIHCLSSIGITGSAFYSREPLYLNNIIRPITTRIRRSKHMYLIYSSIRFATPSSANRRSLSFAAPEISNKLACSMQMHAEIRGIEEHLTLKRSAKILFLNS